MRALKLVPQLAILRIGTALALEGSTLLRLRVQGGSGALNLHYILVLMHILPQMDETLCFDSSLFKAENELLNTLPLCTLVSPAFQKVTRSQGERADTSQAAI